MNKEKHIDNFRRNELPKYEQALITNCPAQKNICALEYCISLLKAKQDIVVKKLEGLEEQKNEDITLSERCFKNLLNKIEKLQDEDEKLTKGILTLEDEVCFAKRRLLRDSKL